MSSPHTASRTRGVHLLIDGHWVYLVKGLTLNQARAAALIEYRRCRVPTEVRERNGTVIQRWEPPTGSPSGTFPPVRIIRSTELLQGASEILIEHRRSIYRLRATDGGRLLLQR